MHALLFFFDTNRYEYFKTFPVESRSQILSYLGLQLSDLREEPKESSEHIEWEEERETHSGAVWQRYFSDDAKRWFKEEAGAALILMKYESDLNW